MSFLFTLLHLIKKKCSVCFGWMGSWNKNYWGLRFFIYSSLQQTKTEFVLISTIFWLHQNSNFLCKKPNKTVKKIKNCQSQLSLLRLGWSSPVMITLGPVVQKSADQICVSSKKSLAPVQAFCFCHQILPALEHSKRAKNSPIF